MRSKHPAAAALNAEKDASVNGDLTVVPGTGAIHPFPISAYIAQNNGYSAGGTDGLLSQFVISLANPHPAITSAASQAIISDFGFVNEPYDAQVTSIGTQFKLGGFTRAS
jgi:hypothetical protein